MIVASGFLIIDVTFQDQILRALAAKGIELHALKEEKVIFLAEGENALDLKKRLDSLKAVEGVQNVYLTYFSLEE